MGRHDRMGKLKNQIRAALERAPIRQAMILPRRKFMIGAATLLAAPAIVRYESLMRVKPVGFISLNFEIEAWTDGTTVYVDNTRVTKGIARHGEYCVISGPYRRG